MPRYPYAATADAFVSGRSLSGADKPHLHQVIPFAKQLLASGWFDRIFWEANTIDIAGIDTYLKALSMHYMLGREDAFLEVRYVGRV